MDEPNQSDAEEEQQQNVRTPLDRAIYFRSSISQNDAARVLMVRPGHAEIQPNAEVGPAQVNNPGNLSNLSFAPLEQVMVPAGELARELQTHSPGSSSEGGMQIDLGEEDDHDDDSFPLSPSHDVVRPADQDANQRIQDLRVVRNFMFGNGVNENQNPENSINHSNVVQRLRNVVYNLETMNRLNLNMRMGLRNLNGTENMVVNNEEETEPENAVRFDTNLPAEHLYLGSNMSRVSGVNYLEPGQEQNLLIFMHAYILFPGEVLPFMISNIVVETELCAENNAFFGICFPFLRENGKKENMYGVTCQIYERGTDEHNRVLIKSRALQRFVLNTKQIRGTLQDITAFPQYKCYSRVKILPEIYLQEPLKCINMGSFSRFRDLPSMQQTYRRYQVACTPLPSHAYESYNMTSIIEKARTQLAEHKIDTMPTDPVDLSFWLVRNLHLPEDLKKEIFKTDSVNTRMMMLASTFQQDPCHFLCRFCGSQIADCKELFAMSKHGVQTQYCNSAGHIHQTNTVYRLVPNSVMFSGEASSEFSWFPGYQWHIIICNNCGRHIGWEYRALELNLVPKIFYGISSSSVRIGESRDSRRDPHELYRAIIRLSRNDMP